MPDGTGEDELEAAYQESTELCSTTSAPDDEALPQKLLLAPLLLDQSSRPQPAASSTSLPEGSIRPPRLQGGGTSTVRPSAPAAQTSSWLRSWWQTAQEDDEEDEDFDNLGSFLGDGWRTQEPHVERAAWTSGAANPSVEQMRRQLLTCVRLLKELQAENGSLCNQLHVERRRAALSGREVDALRRENATLRTQCSQLAACSDPTPPQVSGKASSDGRGERYEVATPPLSSTSPLATRTVNLEEVPEHTHKSELEAELYHAQVALVAIVEELEARLAQRESALETSDQRAEEAEARLEDQRRIAQEDRQDILDFFRKRAPEAEQLWREARAGENANALKRRRAKVATQEIQS